MALNPSAEALLALLRGALYGTKENLLPQDAKWDEVYQLAAEQGVLAIAADGLDKGLSEWDEELYLSWLGQVMLQEQEYGRHCRLIGNISAKLAEKDIPMLLLKGVACSLDYPNPSHRKVGDVDIFCFEKGLEANRLFESLGIEVAVDLAHHSRLVIDGVSIENHHRVMEENTYRSNRDFEKAIGDLLEHDLESVEIGGSAVLVPGPTLMALHLLRHSAMDFASNTINLRQMMDYALLVMRRGQETDWNRVGELVDMLGMRGFFDALNDIAVNVFGIEQSLFPAFKSDAVLRERILDDALYGKKVGEFPDYHKKLIYGVAKTRQVWHNRWKNELVFNEGFVSLYWQKAWNRIKN